MNPRQPKRAAWLGLLLLGASCADGNVSEQTQELTDALSATTGPVQTAEPLSNYKSERKRIALLGLDYSGESVTVLDADRAEALRGYEGQSSADLLAKSQAFLMQGNRIEALTTATRGVLLDSDSSSAYVQLAQALIQNKMTDKALVAYATASDLDPENALVRYSLGDFQWRNGQRAEARATLAEVLELDPNLVEAHSKLASIFFLSGEDQAAWSAIHSVEELGGTVPPQMRQMLSARSTEPQNDRRTNR